MDPRVSLAPGTLARQFALASRVGDALRRGPGALGQVGALRDRPRGPRGPWVVRGRYTVRLTVDGRVFTTTLDVRMDPRVSLAPGTLERQFALASRVVDALRRDSVALDNVRALRRELGPAPAPAAGGPLAAPLASPHPRPAPLDSPRPPPACAAPPAPA